MDRELKHIISLNYTNEIREYYFSIEKEIIMERVCKNGDNCSYYTYGLYEFLAGIKNEEIKKAIEGKL
jgi:hypothetical protein